jgi:hypothetical protein
MTSDLKLTFFSATIFLNVAHLSSFAGAFRMVWRALYQKSANIVIAMHEFVNFNQFV